MRLENRESLAKKREDAKAAMKQPKHRILVCAGTGCLAGGSAKIYDRFVELAAKEDGVEVAFGDEAHQGIHTGVKRSGCHGFCEMGPLVRIEPSNYLYIKVKEDDCDEIFEESIRNDRPVERLLYESDEILESNLRGRGGGGFQTGYKWKQVARQKETERYVVCNGDEGDPGAFMDRSVMEGDPHKMLEGMMIAGYAVGAAEGYIYVRAEYPLAVERLQTAIQKAEEKGL